MPIIQVSNDINRILDETNAEMVLPIEVINDALDQFRTTDNPTETDRV